MPLFFQVNFYNKQQLYLSYHCIVIILIGIK